MPSAGNILTIIFKLYLLVLIWTFFPIDQDTSSRTQGFRQVGQDHVHEGGYQKNPPGTRNTSFYLFLFFA